EAGRALFQGRGSCFTCHGREGGGTPLGPDLTDEAWVNFEQRPTREQVETLITNGVPRPVEHPAPMPPMGGARLSEEEVSQLAAYVLYLGVKETEKGGGPR
ncbi:MAG TPA: cytochrome c, partial [Longimicrobiales bacterium]|nr:cytochrome c [Longimicrobiales bacterium]